MVELTFTCVVITELPGSGEEGANTICVAAAFTAYVPAIWNDDPLTVASTRRELTSIAPAVIGSLTVTVIGVVTGTSVAPFAGRIAVTVGAVVSEAGEPLVVNVLLNGVITFPVLSRRPFTATANTVDSAMLPVGAKVTVT